MCRFNLIYVSKAESAKYLNSIGYGACNETISGYTAFLKGTCNCDSFVGSMCETQEAYYYEMVEHQRNDKLKRLEEIRKFMIGEDYQEERKKYLEEKERIWEQIENLTAFVTAWEMEQTDLAETTFDGDELYQQLQKIEHQAAIMHEEVEQGTEYQELWKHYREHIRANQLMDESTIYYLTKEEEEAAAGESFNLFDLFEEDEFEEWEIMEFPEESYIIDEVIARTRLETVPYEEEWNEYLETFTHLLELEPQIYFSTIWSERNDLEVKASIFLKDLKIEDLASLNMDEVFILRAYKG